MKHSDRTDRQNVSAVLFMRSMGSVLLAAYARLGGGMFTWSTPATTADQRLKVLVLHAVNNRKLVTVEFTVATRRSWNNLSVICWQKLFLTDFRPQIIRESPIYATFSAVGMGSAYTWDGLYASIYGRPKTCTKAVRDGMHFTKNHTVLPASCRVYIFQSLGVATYMRQKCVWYRFVHFVVAIRTARIWQHTLTIFHIMANNYGELRLADLRGELHKRNAKVSRRKASTVVSVTCLIACKHAPES